MRYTDEAQGSALMPKILGTYELELHSAFAGAYAQDDLFVVDVGAAEGYYAVGLLYRNPGARVVAFETTPSGRSLMQHVAMKNQVAERLTILGECDPGTLQSVLSSKPGALVVMDVEGAEEWLLDPATVPALTTSRIIVEVHGGLEDRLEARFSGTHQITRIASREIHPSDIRPIPWRWLAALFKKHARRMLHERSHRMHWLDMKPQPQHAA